jgi:hypothetical protein
MHKLVVFFMVCCFAYSKQTFADTDTSFEYELDAYYSNIAWSVGFEG